MNCSRYSRQDQRNLLKREPKNSLLLRKESNKIKRNISIGKSLKYCNLRKKRKNSQLLPVKGIKSERQLRFLMKNQIVPSNNQILGGDR